MESTAIAQEEPVFFDTTDQHETEIELWKRKDESRNAIPNDPPVITVSCYYANDLRKDTTIVNIAQFTKASRIILEQNSDTTLLNFKREMLDLPFDEQFLIKDAHYMQYSRNKKRTIIKDDRLCRQYYNDFSGVSHSQVLLTQQTYKHSNCYYNHYMIQLANTQAFPKRCKNFDNNIIFFQLQCNIRQKLGSRMCKMHSEQTQKKTLE